MRTALIYAQQCNVDYASIEIHSDCRFLISNILSAPKISPLALHCRSIILSLSVPDKFLLSQSEPGIDFAKSLAREATTLDDSFSGHLDPPPLVRKVSLRYRLWADWNRERTPATSGAITRSFFLTVESFLPIRLAYLPYQLTHLITGHSWLNSHQHRFAFINSPGCRCGAERESVDHFLFYCPLFEAHRSPFKASCPHHLAWPPVLSCLLYTSPSPRDRTRSRMPSSA